MYITHWLYFHKATGVKQYQKHFSDQSVKTIIVTYSYLYHNGQLHLQSILRYFFFSQAEYFCQMRRTSHIPLSLSVICLLLNVSGIEIYFSLKGHILHHSHKLYAGQNECFRTCAKRSFNLALHPTRLLIVTGVAKFANYRNKNKFY